MRLIRLLPLLVGALGMFVSGCATLTTGTRQGMSVETYYKSERVTGALCTIVNDEGTYFVSSPGTVTVKRDYDDISIKCEKEGYEPGIVTASSKTKGLVAANLLIDWGIISIPTDMISGAAYDYPSLIRVQLGKEVHIDEDTPKPDELTGDEGASEPDELTGDEGASEPDELTGDEGATEPGETTELSSIEDRLRKLEERNQQLEQELEKSSGSSVRRQRPGGVVLHD